MKKTVLPLFFTLLVAIPFCLTAQSKSKKRPNVVIIMADDLDSRQLSCYGGKNIRTPYIDQLAGEGLQFNKIYASNATCVPTRASLFTGLYPIRHGSFQNHKPVHQDLKSIGQYLHAVGYKVGLTGKDHSTRPKAVFPFDIVEGFQPNCIASEDNYALEAVEGYMNAEDKPFCMFIMSINPHKPWDLGDPAEFDADKLILPPYLVDTKETRLQFCKYLAEIRRLDNQVGDVMKMLKKNGQDKNTVFVFLGEQGAQFPGGKWTCWDAGQKSSMIVRWPGVVQPNKKTDAIVQYEDITPTIIDIAGGKTIKSLDGISFLPVLKGSSQTARPYAYGMNNNIPEGPAYPSRSVRDMRYKLILNLTPEKTYAIKWYNNPGDLGVWYSWREKAKTDENAKFLAERISKRPAVELYDTRNDPYELNNLAGDPAYAEQIVKLKGALNEWMLQQGDEGASIDRVYPKNN
ncbi:heparan N-sulfatase [Pedobacter psychrodurus]|uniref:Heparan N-sulfatase n=1 Tax=Pedobacter psychrodurus TaxID=2530456 RepID=A0A4R0PZG6_9SPHI|nr:sulfatase [Pedobacter psychrodurus]TCD28650.1 heparan N-sulfatase [Pedobacter psychrodurus]